MSVDYREYYLPEFYLFPELGRRFRKHGVIKPSEFYRILTWKANRAREHHLKRLGEKGGGFGGAVHEIAQALHKSDHPDERLRVLMQDWGFYLPTATAILAVLYPDEYGVYDVRVCGQVGGFAKLAHRRFSPKLWSMYQGYLNAVRRKAPRGWSLRDKDRYLWGKSVCEGVKEDLRRW